MITNPRDMFTYALAVIDRDLGPWCPVCEQYPCPICTHQTTPRHLTNTGHACSRQVNADPL